MKPPSRKRLAPSRFEIEEPITPRTLRLAWTLQEKMDLLKGLKAQKSNKVPNPLVKGRSKSEVSSYISWLRGRAAREAVQTEYEKWVKVKRLNKPKAHIELWTDLLCRMSSPCEEALCAAFSQMFTIASTEPVTVSYSAVKQHRKLASKSSASASMVLQPEGSVEEEPTSSGEVPSAVEEEQAEDPWKKLDFEKVYKYLSKAAKGENLPKLSECESAVLLHLLNCLPDQLQTLNARPLSACLRKTYTYMNSRLKSSDSPEGEGEASPELQEPDWKELKLCPLNPFLLPVELLQCKEEPSTPSRA